jgi:3-phosphoshikimate 1-carboxyvinyltransferase
MMIAPALPDGLTLMLEGRIGSRPYIEMTAALMRHFGASCTFNDDKVIIPHQKYKPATFTVESDWSAAGYWFSFPRSLRTLKYNSQLTLNSLQEIARSNNNGIIGVTARLENELKLQRTTSKEQLLGLHRLSRFSADRGGHLCSKRREGLFYGA